ncbi:hypothetical protein PAECIP111893_03994 [Paenibacillus plantiphilus]|uniref:SLH domain-containing protein n=1 Tax=Paenibacillus plantiphilus TaxID=2905650 RepID=A0ABN8GQN6_9BACL|nr:hypothetical protein PAECIP111893_03994 [Paenibacillus plantiphilus]
MVNRKVISGYPDGKFRPNNTITRSEFAKIMITASGITPKKVNYSSFSDIEATNWASPFVESVKDYMMGYRTADGKYIFNPSAPATREDVAVALVKLKGYDVNRLPDQSTIEAMFKDYAGISESAKSYVSLAVENGLYLASKTRHSVHKRQSPVQKQQLCFGVPISMAMTTRRLVEDRQQRIQHPQLHPHQVQLHLVHLHRPHL